MYYGQNINKKSTLKILYKIDLFVGTIRVQITCKTIQLGAKCSHLQYE